MSWPWSNPTLEEAKEAYFYNKGRYYTIAEMKRETEQLYARLKTEKASLTKEIDNSKAKIKEDKKRFDKVKKLIQMMDGSGGKTNVPGKISKASASLKKADDDFLQAIIISQGGKKPNLNEAFRIKSVEEDVNSSEALRLFRVEKQRIEQEISELHSQVESMSEQLENASKRIRACESDVESYKSMLNSYAYDMTHYRKILINEYDYYVSE